MLVTPIQNPDSIISRFCVCGISYHKTDAKSRGIFSISDKEKIIFFRKAKEAGIRSLFILSTCNRTEVYGYASDVMLLASLFSDVKQIDISVLLNQLYCKKDIEALHHLFAVASGLDSQILGDAEILGQLKKAFTFSRQHEMIGPIMDRTVNFAVQSSKKVKSQTQISNGTTSVSFAAIEWLKKNTVLQGKKILLVGLGKFGTLTAKNIKHYFPLSELIVCNRSNEKAICFAAQQQLKYVAFEELNIAIDIADVVIVSTDTPEPLITISSVRNLKERIFIDLSMPTNIDLTIKCLPQQQLIDLDEISETLSATATKRLRELPSALAIIEDMKQEFRKWLASYHHAPMVKSMKDKLLALSQQYSCCEIAHFDTLNETSVEDEININKVISRLAVNLRTKNEKGCQFIQAYNHFFQSAGK